MKLKPLLCALALVCASGPILAASPSRPELSLAGPLVGLWKVSVTVSPCAGGPARSFLALETYHSGGTLSDTNATPSSLHSPGGGIWQRVGARSYRLHMQSYRFLPDGTYDGVQDIFQDLTLANDGQTYTTSVYARVLNVDGSLRLDLCGSSTATRVAIDQ